MRDPNINTKIVELKRVAEIRSDADQLARFAHQWTANVHRLHGHENVADTNAIISRHCYVGFAADLFAVQMRNFDNAL